MTYAKPQLIFEIGGIRFTHETPERLTGVWYFLTVDYRESKASIDLLDLDEMTVEEFDEIVKRTADDFPLMNSATNFFARCEGSRIDSAGVIADLVEILKQSFQYVGDDVRGVPELLGLSKGTGDRHGEVIRVFKDADGSLYHRSCKSEIISELPPEIVKR